MKNLPTILKPAIIATPFILLNMPIAQANDLTTALTSGKASGNLRLRFEDVDQDNGLKDASALTLRSRIGYETGSVNGFSAKIEVEDSRVVAGQDDYSVPSFGVAGKGHNVGEYSVIADPETTEVDQAYLQYSQNGLSAKLGRQVITLDNHRFVGHVGWRQDRQVFDAFTVNYKASDTLKFSYGYISEREGIFAEDRDMDAKDHLANVNYKTGLGALTGYAYLLETDTSGSDAAIDTYGLRFSGSKIADKTKILYTLEYATQEWSMEDSNLEYDADYMFAELGAVINGVTIKAGYEVLGSDDGDYGFATPLATLHKFNGWTDQFLGTGKLGLVDAMLTVSTKIGKGKLAVIYHDFSPDEDSAIVSDLGTEWNAVYTMKFGKNYKAGIKYANYSAGDSAAGKVDTDKLWIWGELSF